MSNAYSESGSVPGTVSIVLNRIDQLIIKKRNKLKIT